MATFAQEKIMRAHLELIAEGQTFASTLPKFYLARHYTELNRNQEAIATLRSLLEIPNVPVAYRDLAMLNLYFLLNINSAEAQELLDEIISPNSPYRLIALEQRAAQATGGLLRQAETWCRQGLADEDQVGAHQERRCARHGRAGCASRRPKGDAAAAH